MELGRKVCSRCGRALRPGSYRCPACNITFHRRAPRLALGFLLVLLFLLFCGAIYYFIARRSGLALFYAGTLVFPLADTCLV